MKIQKRIGIIACEDSPKWGGEKGLSDYIIRQFARIEDSVTVEVVSFHAVSGLLPKENEIKNFDGFIISGSHHSVNAGYEWVDKIVDFVKLLREMTNGPKLFGICFGHQLIAKALGGKVERNSSGKFVWGTEQIKMAAPPQINALLTKAFGEQRDCFKIIQSHGEWVSVLPKGAVCIGKSSTCDHEFLMYGDTVLSAQGHPELVSEALVGNILPRLQEKGILSKEEETQAKKSLSDEDQLKLMKFLKAFLISK